ncbi:MAG: TetR/AcrR family transcriptional regulator [Bdellovibrionales bacterium]|nr:TetR/AcrR family transcriptional regulator [Bdellovibrionales bacterium]
MTDKKPSKDETYWKVLNCAIELEFKKGHLKWTMTDLSRKSKVTRSLIYYYFGRSKMSILEEAVKVIGEEFVGMSEKRLTFWREGAFEESLLEARKLYERMPYLCAFYLNYRQLPNDIGEALLKLEKAFLRKIANFAPKASKEEVNTIFAVYFGICFSPNVGIKEIKIYAQFIKQIFKGGL